MMRESVEELSCLGVGVFKCCDLFVVKEIHVYISRSTLCVECPPDALRRVSDPERHKRHPSGDHGNEMANIFLST